MRTDYEGESPLSFVETAPVLAAGESVGSILQRLMKMARLLLDDCVSASVTVVDGGRPVTAEFTDEVALEIDLAQYEAGAGPCLRALRQGKTVLTDFNGTAWLPVSEAARRRNIAGALSVPLSVGGITVGGLNLYFSVPGGMGTEADQLAAELLAELGAVAMAASQAAAVERHTARTLQRSFLAGDLAAVTGYDLAAHYDPASSTAEVGGDWSDVGRRTTDRWPSWWVTRPGTASRRLRSWTRYAPACAPTPWRGMTREPA